MTRRQIKSLGDRIRRNQINPPQYEDFLCIGKGRKDSLKNFFGLDRTDLFRKNIKGKLEWGWCGDCPESFYYIEQSFYRDLKPEKEKKPEPIDYLAAMKRVEQAHFRTSYDTGANDCAMAIWNALRIELGLPRISKQDLRFWDGEKYVLPANSNLIK